MSTPDTQTPPPAIDGDTLRAAADRLDALERAHAQTCATVAAFVLAYRQGPDALPTDRTAATRPLVDLLAFIGAPDLHRFGIFPPSP